MRDEALILTKHGMGSGPDELCQLLLQKFLQIQAESDSVPKYVLVYSDGVHLAVEDHPVAGWLRQLLQRGTNVLLCTTCLEYFGLKDKPLVGTPSCMNDIVQAMQATAKLIWL